MIVICTKCQAKFRVADEKVGPRGAKVRCSRCQTVFLVQRDPAAAPPPAPAPQADPFAAGAAPPAADPFGSGDPFAAAPRPAPSTLVTDLSDLLGPAAPPLPAKPRAVPPPLPPPGSRPAPATPAAAPGAAPQGADPFTSPAARREADPFTAPAAPQGADPVAPDAPPASDPAGEASSPLDDGGLALEDRHTPRPLKIAPPPEPPLEFDDASAPGGASGVGAGTGPGGPPGLDAASGASALASGGFDPNVAAAFSADPGDPFDPGAFAPAPDGGAPPLAEAGAPDAAPLEAPPAPPAPAGRAEPPPVPGEPPAAVAAVRRRMAGQRSQVRAVAVNAVALAALLVVALAILAVWRADGSFAPASLRPAALLAALRGEGRATGPYVARQVESGVYERVRGSPLLFVRGSVVSRAPAPVAAVVVSVELVREGAVVARGEAIAGGLATPEELYAAIDADALARAASAARSRAPAEVRPGDELPFLVAVGDAPADLEGTALRVAVAPAADGAR